MMEGKRYRAADEQAYTVPDLAAAWRCNATALREAVTRGEFEGAFKIGRAWRIPKASARAWRERRSPFLDAGAAVVGRR